FLWCYASNTLKVAKMSGFRFVQVPMRRWSMVWHMS
ncbi:hypothetical protein LTSEURB_1431, partial [Salmonella enterica subsp. enterica serovar Urbana str. R8-2977]